MFHLNVFNGLSAVYMYIACCRMYVECESLFFALNTESICNTFSKRESSKPVLQNSKIKEVTEKAEKKNNLWHINQ